MNRNDTLAEYCCEHISQVFKLLRQIKEKHRGVRWSNKKGPEEWWPGKDPSDSYPYPIKIVVYHDSDWGGPLMRWSHTNSADA